MPNLNDYHNRAIRLTEERLTHILSHPEMRGFEAQIEIVLQNPQIVRFVITAYLTNRVKRGVELWHNP